MSKNEKFITDKNIEKPMLLAGVELNQDKIESQNIANDLSTNFSVLDQKKIE